MELTTDGLQYDFNWIIPEEDTVGKLRQSLNTNNIDLSLDIPEFITEEQIRRGKEITEELMKDPFQLNELKQSIAELRQGEIVARPKKHKK